MGADHRLRGTVVLVGFAEEGPGCLAEVLRRHNFTVEVGAAEAALKRAQAAPVQALVARFPLPVASPQGVLAALRAPLSASRRAAFVFVADSPNRSSAEALVGVGANRVVGAEEASRALVGLLDRLAQVAPRLPVKGVARIDLTGQPVPHWALCQTVNVSASGMLVRLARTVPLGSQLRFELFLRPDLGAVAGRAWVVRHTADRREPHPGVGLAFADLPAEQRSRLEQQLALLGSAGPSPAGAGGGTPRPRG